MSTERIWSMSTARVAVIGQAAPVLGSLLVVAVEDSQYYLPRDQDVLEFVKAAKINEIEYIEEVSDCDDFSRKIYASVLLSKVLDQAYIENQGKRVRRPPWLFGIANSVDHAFNFYVPRDGRLRFFEPQTNEVFHPNELDDYVQELRF